MPTTRRARPATTGMVVGPEGTPGRVTGSSSPIQPSARTSLIVEPPDGRIPPLTLGAQTREIDPNSILGFVGGAFDGGPLDGPEDLNLGERCITRGLPHTWFPSVYNNGFQIVQSPGYVAVLYERLHEHRLIPLDGRAPLTADIRQWFGDSRGHWNGDTLVVEVTNFSDRTNYKGAGSTLRLVERYTRVDADTIQVAITVEDPSTWTRPWTFVMTGKRDSHVLADLRVRLSRSELRIEQHLEHPA